MINYLLEASLCWIAFYLLYALLLRQETFFQLNRWYLLATLIGGAVIPLLEIPMAASPTPTEQPSFYLEPITVTVQALTHSIEEIVVSPAADSFNLTTIFWWIYLAGVAFFSFRFLFGLAQIGRLVQQGKVEKYPGYRLVRTKETHLPFSFLNYIFWSDQLEFAHPDHEKILRHEYTHVREGHSYDVILLEVLCILLWCSPVLFFYKKALRNVHEYLADAAVLQDTPTRNYGQLLLRQTQSGMGLNLANHFIHSQLKKRIIMMTKNKSRQRALLKYAMLLPLFVLTMVIFSQQNVMANLNKIGTEAIFSDFDKEAIKKKLTAIIAQYDDRKDLNHQDKIYRQTSDLIAALLKDYPDHQDAIVQLTEAITHDLKVPFRFVWQDGSPILSHFNLKDTMAEQSYKVVDEMPRFPGCEEENKDNKKKCAQQKMLEFIYKSIKYPKEAREKGIEGTAVVRFFVEKNGQLSDFQMIRKISGGCDEEVLRVVKNMPRWIPGKLNGENVRVEFNLPVKFKLDGASKVISVDKKAEAKTGQEDNIFTVVENMPRFPGCEEISTESTRKECSMQNLLEFIYSNIRYPKEAQEAGVQGVSVVKFIITKEGKVSTPEIIRSIGAGTDEEVIRVVNSMPNWIPGMQSGQKVDVYFNLPIRFKLSDDEGSSETETPQLEEAQKAQFPSALSNIQLEAFPNPTSGDLNIKAALQTDQAATLQITDESGKVYFEKTYTKLNISITDLKVTDAPKGPLFLTITQGKEKKTIKVMKF